MRGMALMVCCLMGMGLLVGQKGPVHLDLVPALKTAPEMAVISFLELSSTSDACFFAFSSFEFSVSVADLQSSASLDLCINETLFVRTIANCNKS